MIIEQDVAEIGLLESDEREPDSASSGGPRDGENLTTYTGFTFRVRPADPDDQPALAEFFTHVTKDDLRFRFLSAMQNVSQAQLALLTHADHRRTENFLALIPGTGCVLASAMLAADDDMESAEVAIVIRSAFKGRGVGWRLLQHVVERAEDMGIRTLQSIESQDNRAAIEVERNMGFTARPCPGDPTLVLLETKLGGGS